MRCGDRGRSGAALVLSQRVAQLLLKVLLLLLLLLLVLARMPWLPLGAVAPTAAAGCRASSTQLRDSAGRVARIM